MNTDNLILLEVFNCYCHRCNLQFDACDFSDFEYGRRLLRTSNGDILALVDMISDSVYNQIISEFSQSMDRKCIDSIFSITCDPIEDKYVDLSQDIVCPRCSSSDISRYEYHPMRKIRTIVPLVTHNIWNSKSDEEKRIAINQVIEKHCRN